MKRVKLYNTITAVVSVLVPVVVALLLFLKWTADKLVFDLRSPNFEPIILLQDLPVAKPLMFLPPIYATINGLTAALLVLAVYFIKKGKRRIHENLINWTFTLFFSHVYSISCNN